MNPNNFVKQFFKYIPQADGEKQIKQKIWERQRKKQEICRKAGKRSTCKVEIIHSTTALYKRSAKFYAILADNVVAAIMNPSNFCKTA